MNYYIYIISSKNSPVKIGITHDCEERLRNLQTGHSEKLTIHHRELVDKNKARILEQIIHKQLNYKRTHGEWFDISIDDAIKQVQWCLIRFEDDPLLEYKFKNNLIRD